MQIERLHVSPETVTVLGYKVKPNDARWAGLDFSDVEVLHQSTLMMAIAGKEAPIDLHLSVRWNHPEDTKAGIDSGCRYRVRPQAEVGKKHNGRRIEMVGFELIDGKWYVAIGTESHQQSEKLGNA
jgi:hypothetical protein